MAWIFHQDINTIIGNLKLSISSIHIRYEDLESNPGHSFAAGVTLEKLSASTVDDNGKEVFGTEAGGTEIGGTEVGGTEAVGTEAAGTDSVTEVAGTEVSGSTREQGQRSSRKQKHVLTLIDQ